MRATSKVGKVSEVHERVGKEVRLVERMGVAGSSIYKASKDLIVISLYHVVSLFSAAQFCCRIESTSELKLGMQGDLVKHSVRWMIAGICVIISRR